MNTPDVVFVSNYINHHQIPFCDAMRGLLGDHFRFLETTRMEQERVDMGWQEREDLPYVVRRYENPEAGDRMIVQCDLLLQGWAPAAEEAVHKRLTLGRPVFLISERIYKDGQWKALSPRGLLDKWNRYTRFRDKPYYLLSAGAYVASDFQLIHAFPGRMYRFGYFPEFRPCEIGELMRRKNAFGDPGQVQMIWAGRFVNFKHFEIIPELVRDLAAAGESFHLHVAGDGKDGETYRRQITEQGLDSYVTFYGFRTPEQVRDLMERCRIHIFTSDRGEGWGAVVNESMNAGCAVIAGSEAGCVPCLLQNSVNGMIYNRENYGDLLAKLRFLMNDPELMNRFGESAYRVIRDSWNAKTAAERLMKFAEKVLEGRDPQADLPAHGPMSRDPVLRPYLAVPPLGSGSSGRGMGGGRERRR